MLACPAVVDSREMGVPKFLTMKAKILAATRLTRVFAVLTVAFTLLMAICSTELSARDLRASLAIIPVHAQKDSDGNPTGGFVELIRALDRVYEGKISIELAPFSRSLANVVKGKADLHLPLIRHPHIPLDTLGFAYASEPVTQVTFVLYTNADRPALERDRLSAMRLETLRGHEQFFTFDVKGVSRITQGIDRVVKGRSDGFIMEQEAVDTYVRTGRLRNLRRTLFAVWDSCIVIPKGDEFADIDRAISESLRRLKANGELAKIVATIHRPYEQWQPYETNW
jgi:polar amino acid transport system substrate-binding protein